MHQYARYIVFSWFKRFARFHGHPPRVDSQYTDNVLTISATCIFENILFFRQKFVEQQHLHHTNRRELQMLYVAFASKIIDIISYGFNKSTYIRQAIIDGLVEAHTYII